jgi:hypothetical protein
MFQRLRASIMLTVITVGLFTLVDMFLDTGFGAYIYSLTGMAVIFCVAFIIAPLVIQKLPLR